MRIYSKMTKQFLIYLIINICIIILSTRFLYWAEGKSISLFAGIVMLFSTALAWYMLGRPEDENNEYNKNNEHNQIVEKNDDT